MSRADWLSPPPDSLFEPVHDSYGVRLALVFGNHAAGGVCPYFAAGRCHHCDIGGGEGRSFTAEDNRARLRWFEQRYAEVLPRVAHLILYNSGSTLNPVELPAELLGDMLSWAARLRGLQAVSLDSREAFITEGRVRAAASALGRELRPNLGVESARESVRNGLLDKHMSDHAVRRAFLAVGKVHAEGLPVGMDVNLVVGAPGCGQDPVADALETARYVFELARAAGIRADLNLHPYYPSRRGRERFPAHGRCSLPAALRAIEALDALRRQVSPESRLFVGWQDEGHDQDVDIRRVELSIAREAFDRFNRTQDPLQLAAAR